ncbi:hypothetical protein OIU76_019330 [Salix suchowensis]|nr:hypothetical protein OIU76_019330 [Salix suchowensis]
MSFFHLRLSVPHLKCNHLPNNLFMANSGLCVGIHTFSTKCATVKQLYIN